MSSSYQVHSCVIALVLPPANKLFGIHCKPFVATVPVQVTSVQYSSDSRIKKDIIDTDTQDLLDRMRRIQLREYGYTDDWRKVRNLDDDVRVRGVIAQELRQVFPEHTEILDKLEVKDRGVEFRNFHQVDKQGLLMDGKYRGEALFILL